MLKQFDPHQSIRMLLSRREEEGRGPIIVKVAEQQKWQQQRQQQQQGHRDCQHKQEPRQLQCCLLCAGCGCCCGSGRWQNPLAQASADVDPLRISCQHARRRRGGDPLSSKPRSYNDDNNDDNDNDDKDAALASVSKNDNDHDIIFFAVVGEAAERQQ